MTEPLVLEEIRDRIGIVTLNRPEALNAISGALADELSERLWWISRNEEVWVVILRAAGDRAFCVGADLKERASFSLYDFYRNRDQMRQMFATVRRMAQPVVASVFGFALGGGFELALSCDLIVASRGTEFGLPEARVGLLPAGGGTQLLTRKIGTSRAKEMIFRGRRIDSVEAQQLGIVCDVTERDDLDDYTMHVARDICKSSPIAIREAKAAVDQAVGTPLEQGIEIEHAGWRRVIMTEDRVEGIEAFNGKRDPRWKGR
jgi:enoyl-CoA hydratase/carnithine racemase